MDARFDAHTLVRISSQTEALPFAASRLGRRHASVASYQEDARLLDAPSEIAIADPLGDFSQQTGALFG